MERHIAEPKAIIDEEMGTLDIIPVKETNLEHFCLHHHNSLRINEVSTCKTPLSILVQHSKLSLVFAPPLTDGNGRPLHAS